MASQGSSKKRPFESSRGTTETTERKRIKAQHRYRHADYTIGWICALSLEFAVAKAVLDEEHATLLNSPGDNNVYCLGSIHGHNIAITCLPSGCYGINQAAVVSTHLRYTFPNITASLMVGVGGGVPSSKHDIRLGDVVVSLPRPDFPAVVQYDFGKTEDYGLSHAKGSLNKPPTALLKAVAGVQSEHHMGRNKIQMYMREALQMHRLPTFNRLSASNDVLYEAECDHCEEEDVICTTCGPRKEIARAPRSTEVPVIHYGTIGSGNQVIKHGRSRDRYAQKFDILCFETEAAGLMDELPCIIIRGICDYCDKFKNKDFQGHAALTAAAYAKELLSMVPIQQSLMRDPPQESLWNQNPIQPKQERWDALIATLTFDEADSRLQTLKKAHPQTCTWLLGQTEHTEWLDDEKNTDHHGLLWIRGKPGTGKSTIMKFLIEQAEKSKSENHIITSFFFHARGEELQKSTIGMYRSLLFQVFKKAPQLHKILDTVKQQLYNLTWTLSNLEKLFSDVIENLGPIRLSCYIDALDECPEEQIRDLLAFWQTLGDLALEKGIHFRVCLSSRHYPLISVRAGIEFNLEDQEGHSNDIRKYVGSELKVIGRGKKAEEIKNKVYTKSGRIFLWVVLVVQILKTENDRGSIHKLDKRLDEIPVELNKLFLDILVRDNKDLPELILCIQWILFAKKALGREELYFALLAGDMSNLAALADWDHEELNAKTMDRHILNCSKGLAETTRSKNPSVQFIHESVREFLLQPGTLNQLWSGFKDLEPGPSHQRLRQCCRLYLDFHDDTGFEVLLQTQNPELTLKEKYPFLKYAAEQMLSHAEEAEKLDFSEAVFMDQIPQIWMALTNGRS